MFGHLKSLDAEYFLIYGTVRIEDEQHPGVFHTEVDNGDGYVFQLSRRGCLVNGAYEIFFSDSTSHKPRIKMPDNVLDEFAADIIERYAAAFGRTQFLNMVYRQKRLRPDLYNEIPPVILRQLEILKKRSAQTKSK